MFKNEWFDLSLSFPKKNNNNKPYNIDKVHWEHLVKLYCKYSRGMFSRKEIFSWIDYGWCTVILIVEY